jgi:hypothetical protein
MNQNPASAGDTSAQNRGKGSDQPAKVEGQPHITELHFARTSEALAAAPARAF